MQLDWLRSLWYKSPSDVAFLVKNYTWVASQMKTQMSALDLGAFTAIGQKQERLGFNPLYLDLADTMRVSLYRVRRLGLDSAPPLRLLDLGTGPGVFPYLAARFGHRVRCTDIDSVPYYNDLTDYFKLDRHVWRVETGVPAPDLGTFDLVTATNVGFNYLRGGKSAGGGRRDWGIDEWDFFLRDLTDRLVAPGGRIYFTINQLQRRGRDVEVDRKLLAYFASRGATFPSYGHVLFNRTDGLRTAKAS